MITVSGSYYCDTRHKSWIVRLSPSCPITKPFDPSPTRSTFPITVYPSLQIINKHKKNDNWPCWKTCVSIWSYWHATCRFCLLSFSNSSATIASLIFTTPSCLPLLVRTPAIYLPIHLSMLYCAVLCVHLCLLMKNMHVCSCLPS